MNYNKKLAIILIIGLLIINLKPLSYCQTQSKEEEAIFVAKKAFEDGYYEVSLSLLERFLNNFPNSSKVGEARLLVGECYFYQNRFLDALDKFEGLLKNPASKNLKDATLYWIAEVYLKSNNFSKASALYHRIIDEFPNSSYVPSAFYSLGWSSFQENKFQEACDYFKATEEKYPNEPQAKDAAFKIIECLYNLKDYASLREKGRLSLKLFSQDLSRLFYLYFYLAEAEYYLGNFNQSLEYYAKVLKESSDDKMQALSRLGSGWAYLKLKRYGEAEGEFSLLKEDSFDKKGLEALLLGRAALMLETNRISDASKVYGRLILTAVDPLIATLAYQGKADALYNLAEYEESSLFYLEALKKAGPINTSLDITDKLHYNLGLAFSKQEKSKEAIKEFQLVAKDSGNKIMRESALVQLGGLYQDSGDYLLAVKSYESVLRDYPDSLYKDYIQYQLGSIFLKKLDYDAAIKLLSAFKENFPGSKYMDDVYYLLGLAYFRKEDYASSIKILEQSRKEPGENGFPSKSAYLLASSRYNTGDFSKAVELFKETISHSQDTELIQRAEYGIADSLYQLGDKKEALSRFKALRSKYPGSNLTADVVFWLASYYYQNGEFSLARRYFLSLIQDFPGSPLVTDAYYSLGLISNSESSLQEAIENFKKVIDSDNLRLKVAAASALGDLFYKLEDYTQALAFYRKGLVLSTDKENPALRIKIAETLEAKGEIDEAVGEYLKVSADNNLKAKAYLRLARIHEDRDEFKEAAKFYKQAIALGNEEGVIYAKERLEWINANIKN
ncbi:MAG: tetratricopeptide repeat protein [Candidatus Omnitrophota bacterium]|jgi:TolA-binding protein